MMSRYLSKPVTRKFLGAGLLITLAMSVGGCASSGTVTYGSGYDNYYGYGSYYGAGWGDNYYDRRGRANFYYGRPRGYGGRW